LAELSHRDTRAKSDHTVRDHIAHSIKDQVDPSKEGRRPLVTAATKTDRNIGKSRKSIDARRDTKLSIQEEEDGDTNQVTPPLQDFKRLQSTIKRLQATSIAK